MNFTYTQKISSGILKKTKDIVKEDEKYRDFIITHERFKQMNFIYNNKLKRLPMLFPYYQNEANSFSKRRNKTNVSSRNVTPFNKRESKNKTNLKLLSYDNSNLEECNGVTVHNRSNYIYNHKQLFLITQSNTSPFNSFINTSFYTSNSFRSYNNDYSFRSTNLLRNKKNNSSFLRFHHELFQNSRYDSLKFDESNIYGNKDELFSFIEGKVRDLATNKNYNNTECLDKKLKANGNEFNIKLSSLTVTFYDMKGNQLCNEYILPLTLLPVFYYKGIDHFKMLLTKMVSFDIAYTTISINENILFAYLRNSFKMPLCFSPIKKYDENDSNSNHNSTDKLKIKRMNTTHLSKNPFTPIFKKKLSIKIGSNRLPHNEGSNSTSKQIDVELEIPQENTKSFEIYQNNNNSSENKCTDKRYLYEFIWITPSKSYRVEIKTPTVVLREKKSNLCLHSYLDFEFLFYLYKRNFIDWDFYCLNYLFSFKQCRQIMDKCLSKIYDNSLPIVLPNTIIHLNHKDKLSSIKLHANDLKFIVSEYGNNKLIVIKPPSYKITLMKYKGNTSTDYQNDYTVNFNIMQAIKLIKSLEIVNSYKLKDMLEKFITVKHLKNSPPIVEFNYDEFDSINETDWLELLKGIGKFSNQNNETEEIDDHLIEIKNKEIDSISKKATEFVYPCLIKKSFNDEGKEIIEHNEFILPLFKKLIKRDINLWPSFCTNMLKVRKKESSDSIVEGFKRRKTFHFKSIIVTPQKIKRKASLIV